MGKIHKLEDHINNNELKYLINKKYSFEVTAYLDGTEPITLIGLDVSVSKTYTEIICTYIDSKNVTHITNKIDNIFMEPLKTKAARALYAK